MVDSFRVVYRGFVSTVQCICTCTSVFMSSDVMSWEREQKICYAKPILRDTFSTERKKIRLSYISSQIVNNNCICFLEGNLQALTIFCMCRKSYFGCLHKCFFFKFQNILCQNFRQNILCQYFRLSEEGASDSECRE